MSIIIIFYYLLETRQDGFVNDYNNNKTWMTTDYKHKPIEIWRKKMRTVKDDKALFHERLIILSLGLMWLCLFCKFSIRLLLSFDCQCFCFMRLRLHFLSDLLWTIESWIHKIYIQITLVTNYWFIFILC